MNINTCRVSELDKQNMMYKSKEHCKYVAKLLKYKILFKDIFTLWDLFIERIRSEHCTLLSQESVFQKDNYIT